MSVQFGKCNFDGKPVGPEDLDEARPVLAPYGPDGEGYICKGNVGILCCAFHVTKESCCETLPHALKSGSVMSWDGRLDNREPLIRRLALSPSHNCTDLEIAAAAYELWGTGALEALIGDWALSIWNPNEHSVILAKDFLGTRHLYYTLQNDRLTWCSILDPLILLAKQPLKLEEEYIAGWLSLYPAPHTTPYVGIHSVPPSSFVRITKEGTETRKYWNFDPASRIAYRTDQEYEEHFRSLFQQSVRRRLRSLNPVVAELSGGVDSSSIVCVGDAIISCGSIGDMRLDTISYYDDTEPSWNERPYFTKVEEKRGRTGCHINVAAQEHFCSTFMIDRTIDRFAATPTSMSASTEATKEFEGCLRAQGYRVLLSGIGGDEVAGGVPTPIPELADLVATMRLGMFAKKLKAFALSSRRPLLHLLAEVAQELLPCKLRGSANHSRPPRWLRPDFARRNTIALQGYPVRLRFLGGLPSFQENLAALEMLRRQLACSVLAPEPLYETAYPYLDRDLLAFLFTIPREQLVRPGQRRSLIRRALKGIVPNEILNRRRKGVVSRPPVDLHRIHAAMRKTADQIHGVTLGIISQNAFLEALERAAKGHESTTAALIRALTLELWLGDLANHQVITSCVGFASRDSLFSSPRHQKAFGH